MDDLFAEYIVKRILTPKAVLIRIVLVMVCILSFASFNYVGSTGLLVVVVTIYLAWYGISLTSEEVEYSILNSDLRIDKIYGQKRRKKMAEYDLKKAVKIAYLNSGEFSNPANNTTIKDFSSLGRSDNKLGILISDSGANTLVVIEPSEKIMDVISKVKPMLVKGIKKEAENDEKQ